MAFVLSAVRYVVLAAGLPALADTGAPSGDVILSRVEGEFNRRHVALKAYTGARQYTIQNTRFGKQAAVGLRMQYGYAEGERYTVVSRVGSDKLTGIIDRILASERSSSMPSEMPRHEINSNNYAVKLLGSEVVGGRNCYILDLKPRMKKGYLINGKAWIDAGTFGVVRVQGQFAASLSVLVGAPRISEDYVEVRGFWMPGHVHSVTSSFLLGPTELDIVFSDYQLDASPSPPSG